MSLKMCTIFEINAHITVIMSLVNDKFIKQ